jgi:hypothetical protein
LLEVLVTFDRLILNCYLSREFVNLDEGGRFRMLGFFNHFYRAQKLQSYPSGAVREHIGHVTHDQHGSGRPDRHTAEKSSHHVCDRIAAAKASAGAAARHGCRTSDAAPRRRLRLAAR